MKKFRLEALLTGLLILVATSPARADAETATVSPVPPSDAEAPNYVTAMVGTTLAYRAPSTPFAGPQGDVLPMVGFGRFLSKKIAIELDAGPAFAAGKYFSFLLVPGVVWAFHPNVYAAGRFIAAVHPKTNFALAPGLGVTYAFANGVAPFAEVNTVSFIARGTPDFGVSGTFGAAYGF